MLTRLELKLHSLALSALFPLAQRRVPHAAELLVVSVRRQLWLRTGKRAEVVLHRLPMEPPC